MKKLIMLVVLSCGVAACSPIKPFVDARREAGQAGMVGQSTPDHVAVCYNKYMTTKEEIEALAEKECQKIGRHAVYDTTVRFSCCFITPTTAFYYCRK